MPDDYSPQELVLLLVAIAARTVSNKVEIRSYKPLQVIPNLGGPKTLSSVGIDEDRVRAFKKALITCAPDPIQADISNLNITPADRFADLRATLEVMLFASTFKDQDDKKKDGEK